MSVTEHILSEHVPVMLNKVVELLKPVKGESYLDLTAGYGGHASQILAMSGNYAGSVLVDRDDNAISYLRKRFENQPVEIIHDDFVAACQQLIEAGREFDIVLVDLGVSSPQLDQAQRGFSFTNNGPLDMRMDRRQEKSAATLLDSLSVSQLAHIINLYGEEPLRFSETIAKAIVANRPLSTTKELADLIKRNYRGGYSRIHPATRTFQAIRIAVNDELQQVVDLMPLLARLLRSGGRVGIISFHSLEDRIIKQYLKENSVGLEAIYQLITKKPICANQNNLDHNPRARSAKLRAAVKK